MNGEIGVRCHPKRVTFEGINRALTLISFQSTLIVKIASTEVKKMIFKLSILLLYCALSQVSIVSCDPESHIECVVNQEDFSKYKWRCNPDCNVAATGADLPAPLTGQLEGNTIWYLLGNEQYENQAMYKNFTGQQYGFEDIYVYMEYYNGVNPAHDSQSYVLPVDQDYIWFLPPAQNPNWSTLFAKLDSWYIQQYPLELGMFSSKENEIIMLRQLAISYGYSPPEYIQQYCKSVEDGTVTTTAMPTTIQPSSTSSSYTETTVISSSTISSSSTSGDSSTTDMSVATESTPSGSTDMSSSSQSDASTASTDSISSSSMVTDSTSSDFSTTTVISSTSESTVTDEETSPMPTTSAKPDVVTAVSCIQNVDDFNNVWGSHPAASAWDESWYLPGLDVGENSSVWCIRGDHSPGYISHNMSRWENWGIPIDSINEMTIHLEHYFHEPGSYISFNPAVNVLRESQKRQFLTSSTKGVWSQDTINISIQDAKAYQVEGNTNFMATGSLWCFRKMVISVNKKIMPSDINSCQ